MSETIWQGYQHPFEKQNYVKKLWKGFSLNLRTRIMKKKTCPAQNNAPLLSYKGDNNKIKPTLENSFGCILKEGSNDWKKLETISNCQHSFIFLPLKYLFKWVLNLFWWWQVSPYRIAPLNKFALSKQKIIASICLLVCLEVFCH